ncbi:MAG: hypothetical protein PHO27_13185 [Sulfuricurvum sp.]|nr:hypothetical protein [Sulfuricurvum sp.]
MKRDNEMRFMIEWIESNDGLLALDKNDSVYNVLNVWIDTNQNGVTDRGELHVLKEMGVTSINLGSTSTNTYEAFNTITNTSTFTQQTTDAQGNTITETKTVNDVWFKFKIQKKAA